MIAVIFTATVADTDQEYATTADALRRLALEQYGCREFTAVTEGQQEIAVSIWDSEEQVIAWKQDPAHLRAQQMGRQRWYQSYRVRVTEVLRDYTG